MFLLGLCGDHLRQTHQHTFTRIEVMLVFFSSLNHFILLFRSFSSTASLPPKRYMFYTYFVFWFFFPLFKIYIYILIFVFFSQSAYAFCIVSLSVAVAAAYFTSFFTFCAQTVLIFRIVLVHPSFFQPDHSIYYKTNLEQVSASRIPLLLFFFLHYHLNVLITYLMRFNSIQSTFFLSLSIQTLCWFHFCITKMEHTFMMWYICSVLKLLIRGKTSFCIWCERKWNVYVPKQMKLQLIRIVKLSIVVFEYSPHCSSIELNWEFRGKNWLTA